MPGLQRPRIREVGDSALLLEFEPVIDASVNARAIGVAAAIRARGVAGVRDVVPTFRSVAVHFDPLGTDVSVLTTTMSDAAATARPVTHGSTVEVPVIYGGDEGPDLGDVAAFARISADEVVTRHSAV